MNNAWIEFHFVVFGPLLAAFLLCGLGWPLLEGAISSTAISSSTPCNMKQRRVLTVGTGINESEEGGRASTDEHLALYVHTMSSP